MFGDLRGMLAAIRLLPGVDGGQTVEPESNGLEIHVENPVLHFSASSEDGGFDSKR